MTDTVYYDSQMHVADSTFDSSHISFQTRLGYHTYIIYEPSARTNDIIHMDTWTLQSKVYAWLASLLLLCYIDLTADWQEALFFLSKRALTKTIIVAWCDDNGTALVLCVLLASCISDSGTHHAYSVYSSA